MTDTSKSQCFAVGCAAMKPSWALMCPRHWRMVPSHLQAEVYSSHAAWKKDDSLLLPYLIHRGHAQLAVAKAEYKSKDVFAAIEAEIAGYEARDGR
jgi:hypothetical protein